MSECCVVGANGSRARLFTLEPTKSKRMQSGPKLVEQKDLVLPEKDTRGRDLWTDLKSGRGRAWGGGPSHGYDDHREQHVDKFERRFAQKVADEAKRLAEAKQAKRLIVVAEKRMLGFLREAFTHSLKTGMEIEELAKDLSKLSPAALQDHLAGKNLLPPRTRGTISPR